MNTVTEKLTDIDLELATIEDTLHGHEGKVVTATRGIIQGIIKDLEKREQKPDNLVDDDLNGRTDEYCAGYFDYKKKVEKREQKPDEDEKPKKRHIKETSNLAQALTDMGSQTVGESLKGKTLYLSLKKTKMKEETTTTTTVTTENEPTKVIVVNPEPAVIVHGPGKKKD